MPDINKDNFFLNSFYYYYCYFLISFFTMNLVDKYKNKTNVITSIKKTVHMFNFDVHFAFLART